MRACSGGPYRFSALVGTIFENTKKPLRDWFRVAHLMLASKKGMSALQIQRMMGFGSYETAHSMCHKIRAALIAPETKLGGIVEVDETWVGGKDHNRHWNKRHHGKGGGAGTGKTPVIGAVERQGNVIARVLDHVNKHNVEKFVREAVSNKVSLLATDEHQVYWGLKEYPRESVKHRNEQYVVGAVHTNTIEGFFCGVDLPNAAWLARSTRCERQIYVALCRGISVPHNNRNNPDMFASAIAGC